MLLCVCERFSYATCGLILQKYFTLTIFTSQECQWILCFKKLTHSLTRDWCKFFVNFYKSLNFKNMCFFVKNKFTSIFCNLKRMKDFLGTILIQNEKKFQNRFGKNIWGSMNKQKLKHIENIAKQVEQNEKWKSRKNQKHIEKS